MSDTLAYTPCDTCAHRSYVFASLPSGLELSYCAHHGRKYRASLIEQGAYVVDMTHLVGAS